MNAITPVLLLILDGLATARKANNAPSLHANTPNWDALRAHLRRAGRLRACRGPARRAVWQFGSRPPEHRRRPRGAKRDISRIDADIEQGCFANNPVIADALNRAKASRLHVFGLLSDGGVHSPKTIFRPAAAAQAGVEQVSPCLPGWPRHPAAQRKLFAAAGQRAGECPNARLVSVCGRFWAMDRGKRWERVQTATSWWWTAKGIDADTGLATLAAAAARDENDEFVKPTAIGAPCRIAMAMWLFMNFRADCARELSSAPTDRRLTALPPASQAGAVCPGDQPARRIPTGGLSAANPEKRPGRIPGRAGNSSSCALPKPRKYPHVTYFFGGGEEQVYPGEDRILVQSPRWPPMICSRK